MASSPQGFNLAHRDAPRNSPRRLQTAPHRAHDLIRSSIRTGLHDDGMLVEGVLSRSLSTSRNAIRQALQLLAAEGLVERRPNRGTTVVRNILDVDFDQLVPDGAFRQARATVRELDHRLVPATEYIRRRLDITDSAVDMAEVLITVDDEPVSIRVSYIATTDEPVTRIADVVPFRDAFLKLFGAPLGESEASIGAIAAPASAAKLLGIEEGAPLIVEELLIADANGVPRELSYTHYRADRVSLSVKRPVDTLRVDDQLAG